MQPQLGEVRTARRDGTRLFRLRGEFDLSNAWKIQDALIEAISNDQDDIVVDLADVSFMDARLLRALVRARAAARRRDVAFVIVPPKDPDVCRVVRIADFPLAA